MIELDGSKGEGGGQILRSALSLSLITQTPFRIARIRANRQPGGLRPQHLACVRGAEAISNSTSEGAKVGATELTFFPGAVTPGKRVLEVGTAGSTPLLFQCLFYPLALAGGGELELHGGTHLPQSPIYHYLAFVWAPAVAAFGMRVELSLRHAGFYPEGGGEFRAQVFPPSVPPLKVELPSRGTLRDVEVMSFVAGLPFDLADRQSRAAKAALIRHGIVVQAENFPLPTTRSQGTALFIRAHFENTFAGFTALGEKGVRAETVGQTVAEEMDRFMASAGALDVHLADQLLLPAALLAAGRLGASAPGTTTFTTERVSGHLTTNALVIERFLSVRIQISPQGEVFVGPSGGS
ncbi:MAG: RNA 3'-terminal phosphate cyclase [Myxococcaceae bacterium]